MPDADRGRRKQEPPEHGAPGVPIRSPWVAVMNRQTEIARKPAAELALPLAQRSRAGMGPPRDAVRPDDRWSF